MGQEVVSVGKDVNGRVRVRKAREKGWTTKRRTVFLDHLAATCNVSLSARAVGIHNASAYALRRRDAGFAAAWQEALAVGYARLEAMLIERATGWSAEREQSGGLPDPAAFDSRLAMDLVRAHGAAVKGGGGRRIGGRVHVADRAETARIIIERIARIRRRDGDGA